MAMIQRSQRFIIGCLSVFVLVLSLLGGVTAQESTFSLDAVREEAFWKLDHWMDVSMFPEKDPQRKSHKKALKKGRHNFNDRTLTIFKTGSYRVEMPGFGHGLYYRSDGTLSAVEFYLGDAYPYKIHQYSYPFGRLLKTTIQVSPDEIFTFSPTGRLTQHWLEGLCYQGDKEQHSCSPQRVSNR